MSHPNQPAPVAEYLLAAERPGDAGASLVLPIALLAQMPRGWQDHLVRLLVDLHAAYQHAPWPRYRVRPTRQQPVSASSELDLAAVGITTDLAPDGTLLYRDADGDLLDDPDTRMIHVPAGPDPLLPQHQQ